MKKEVFMPSPLGTIKVTTFNPNDDVSEVHIDLMVGDKEFNLLLLTVEEDEETEELDIVSRIFSDGEDFWDIKVRHSVTEKSIEKVKRREYL